MSGMRRHRAIVWLAALPLLAILAWAVIRIGTDDGENRAARTTPPVAENPAPTVEKTETTEVAEAPSRHSNRLIHEKSPYLLQHAHNPVDWYPWGEEAFDRAKRENKPIFLSIGYSTCYWCHVMEKESFETGEVAEILNENFIAIKVDREERPDIDEQYMLATQLVTGRGGWPNSLWLTPDGRPWMAGTYFPKPQFVSALTRLAGIWKDRRADVDKQASAIASAMADAGNPQRAGGAGPTTGSLTPALIENAVASLTSRFDPVNAGFGDAPKFPPHGTLQLLLRQYRDTKNGDLLTPITRTLDAMWLGGMHDHIGGGFHRYSTDNRWLVPHFEKMLYDNAQLMRNYTGAFIATGHQRYRNAVEDIFAWVRREMTAPEGAFYSAIDSGEVGGEGEAYVWQTAEVEKVLGKEDGALFAEIYAFEKDGNFSEEASGRRTGSNIPHLSKPVEAVAAERGVDPVSFAERISEMRARLLAARQTRPQPHKDDKILTGWNGLMIAALAHAGKELDEPRYTAAAARAADFILRTMVRDGRLLRTYRAGEAKLPGYLDDYAYFTDGLIELHRANGEARWLEQADRFATDLVRDFQDEQDGGFYFTANYHENLIMRSKSLGGGGNVPDANGVAAQVLLELADLTGNAAFHAAAQRTVESLAGLMERSPFSTEHLLLAASGLLGEQSAPSPPPLAQPGATSVAETTSTPENPDVSKRADAVTIRGYASRLAVKPGGRIDVAVAIDIDDGWHLYGENSDAAFLIPTTVSVESSAPFTAGEITAPKPRRAKDPILDQMLNTHTGRIWFSLPVSVASDAPPGAVTLGISVKTQACDANRCLQPQTTELKIPIQIDPDAPAEPRHPGLFAHNGG